MYRLAFFSLIFVLFLLPHPQARASEVQDIPIALKSRKVIGVIYFKKDSVELSKTQQAEIDRIASLVVAQYSPDKIVRVEGFSTQRDRRHDPLTASLSRAKSVWYYLGKMNSINWPNLYLTGFSAKQSISNLQGERVEIVIYENPFNEKLGIYSSN